MYIKTIRSDWVIFDINHRGMVSDNYDPDENIRGWSASLQRAMIFTSRSEAESFARDNDITDYVVLSTNDKDVPAQESGEIDTTEQNTFREALLEAHLSMINGDSSYAGSAVCRRNQELIDKAKGGKL